MKLRRKHRPPAEGMTRYVGHVSVNLVGCKVEFEFDVESDASEDQVDEVAREVMFEHIDWSYEKQS